MFRGAVKKQGKATPFTIKLLVPYRLFAMGVVALRQCQAKLGDVAHLTNAQIANRYQGTLKEGLDKMVSGGKLALPEGMGVHEMRATCTALLSIIASPPHARWRAPRCRRSGMHRLTMTCP